MDNDEVMPFHIFCASQRFIFPLTTFLYDELKWEPLGGQKPRTSWRFMFTHKEWRVLHPYNVIHAYDKEDADEMKFRLQWTTWIHLFDFFAFYYFFKKGIKMHILMGRWISYAGHA
ncbi:hypothetical protein ACJX0J_022553 [Zea mays]